MKNITEHLSKFIENLNSLPKNVVEQTKMFIADYIASILAGYRLNKEVNSAVLSLMEEMSGAEQSSVLFSDRKYPVSNAAFLNALYSHGADIDDGNKLAAGHIGSHVMSSVFAVAETLQVSWQDVFTAINVGYEVFNRISGAAQPSLYNNGFHSTSIAGSVACAAACAKLYGLNAAGIYNAISLGAIQANGLIIIDESGQSCKPINPANAARTGVISAQLAKRGINSSRNPLESKKGWFAAFSDEFDEEVLLTGFGEDFTICDSYLKLYPTCRHTHCGIEAAINIRERLLNQGKRVSDISSIQVITYPSAIRSTGAIRYPNTQEEAKFSFCYCLATALSLGKFGFKELDCGETSEAVISLIEKIELISDDKMENRKTGIRGAKVLVKLLDSTILEETILVPKGEATKPFTWDDIRTKMNDCAEGLKVDGSRLISEVQAIKMAKPFIPWMTWII